MVRVLEVSHFHHMTRNGRADENEGLGFAVRDESHQDVEDDIDIDGEDEVLYGAAQFTEVDVVGPNGIARDEDEDVAIDDDDTHNEPPRASGSGIAPSGEGPWTIRTLVAEGKVVKNGPIDSVEFQDVKHAMDEVMGVGETEMLDRAIELARKSCSSSALVEALENKVKQLVSLPYTTTLDRRS